MPNITNNLGLNVFLENEPVNFEEINANFEKIDALPICIESGTKTASYTGGSDSVATWRYRKYSDGTVEMSARLGYTNIKCNAGSTAPYYSGASTVKFPLAMSSVYDVQMHLASNTVGWVCDISNRTVLDQVVFRLASVWPETDELYKQVFINVKGVLA